MPQPAPIPPASDHTRPRAVIVGGGVAGLAAALRLGERDWPTLVLEREDRPGGLARSLRFHGVASDLGPHRIHTEIPEVMALIERIAEPSLYRVRRASRIYLRGRFLPYPPDPLAMARHLGPLRMAGFAGSFALGRLLGEGSEESYDGLMRRAFGRRLYEFLLRPYSQKTWKIDPAELHADTARVRVSAGSLAQMALGAFRRERKGSETALREFRYVRGGAETLVRHLREHAEAVGARLEVGRRVRALELGEDLRVAAALHGPAVDAGDAPAERAEGEVYLSTAPLPELVGELLPPAPWLEPARRAARELHYLDMVLVFLVIDRPEVSGQNWLYFPEPHLIFNRGYEPKSFDPTMVPGERSVLCLEVTTRPGDEADAASDDELAARVIRDLAGTGLVRADEVRERVVHRLRFAYPLYRLDYRERLGETLAALSRIPNLLTLGRQGLFNHNNMDHSIWMGLRAGDMIGELGAAAGQRQWYEQVDQFKSMRIVD